MWRETLGQQSVLSLLSISWRVFYSHMAPTQEGCLWKRRGPSSVARLLYRTWHIDAFSIFYRWGYCEFWGTVNQTDHSFQYISGRLTWEAYCVCEDTGYSGFPSSVSRFFVRPKNKDANTVFFRVEVGKETGDMEHSRVLETVAQNERGRIQYLPSSSSG